MAAKTGQPDKPGSASSGSGSLAENYAIVISCLDSRKDPGGEGKLEKVVGSKVGNELENEEEVVELKAQ
ncbi:hypothetical protein Ddc_15084 [Ditylenchus destructor]|nr:hypothetical protein Ddc_15084 [Ditylenchus destructor]